MGISSHLVQGTLRAQWRETEGGRQAKFYSLTAAGRSQLERDEQSWNPLSTVINPIVESECCAQDGFSR
jgi:DNA-binding PadR family transcriptional regulator